jgi:hypothetical protein
MEVNGHTIGPAADLRGANLTGENLKAADLTGANLTGANLTGANLKGANLTRAILTRAILPGAEKIKAGAVCYKCGGNVSIFSNGTVHCMKCKQKLRQNKLQER